MYRQLAEIPVPTSAQFIPSENDDQSIVQLNFSVKDHDRNVKRTMAKSVILPAANPVLESNIVSTPLLDIDVVAQVVSSSGKKRATLRNIKLVNGTSSRIIEVWNNSLLEISLNVTEYHGEFYTDEYLSSFSFAPSERAIIYTAEGNLPESKDPYVKFRFNPDFGEGLSGKRRPTSFILCWTDPSSGDISSPRPNLVQLEPVDGVRFGQAVFSPFSDEIVYATGYELTIDGRFLGIKGCYNRPTGIWELRTAAVSHSAEITNPPNIIDLRFVRKLTSGLSSCRSPRILTGQNKSTLLWLSSRSGGAHLASSTLLSLDVSSDTLDLTPTTLVDIVDVSEGPGTFPGLYPAYNLPSNFALKPDHASSSILVASQWGSRTIVLAISAETGTVKNLTPDSDGDLYSWSVLATDGQTRVICSRSAPSVPYEIVLGDLTSTGSISWAVIDRPSLSGAVTKALSTVRASIIPIPDRPLVETIVIQGERKNLTPPCITSPHGGPHGVTSTAFSPATIAFVLAGYTLSLPNYSGSPGYGEDFLQKLVGKCGELDVKDCIASAMHLIDRGISEPGPGKQFISGGSHGGFLTAHLIGQFPDFFSAAVLRNPVIAAGDISNTDIPDWYFSEFGLKYPVCSTPSYYNDGNTAQLHSTSKPPLITVKAFEKLQFASPTAFLDEMKTPVLLLIGAADRRVAPAQGILFYHALKARYSLAKMDTKVDMLMFEGESHPIDGVEASKIGFEATLDWFLQEGKSVL